jgi:LPXTG-motif cell wall-anchored protein
MMFYLLAATTIAVGAGFVVVRRKRKAGTAAN